MREDTVRIVRHLVGLAEKCTDVRGQSVYPSTKQFLRPDFDRERVDLQFDLVIPAIVSPHLIRFNSINAGYDGAPRIPEWVNVLDGNGEMWYFKEGCGAKAIAEKLFGMKRGWVDALGNKSPHVRWVGSSPPNVVVVYSYDSEVNWTSGHWIVKFTPSNQAALGIKLRMVKWLAG